MGRSPRMGLVIGSMLQDHCSCIHACIMSGLAQGWRNEPIDARQYPATVSIDGKSSDKDESQAYPPQYAVVLGHWLLELSL
jgi:hypothetical protein